MMFKGIKIKKYLNYDSYLIFRPQDRTKKKLHFKERIRIHKSKDFSISNFFCMPILFESTEGMRKLKN